MAIRVFLSTWRLATDLAPDDGDTEGGVRDIVTAIEDAQRLWTRAMTPTKWQSINYYPDRDLDGVPDQPWVLVRFDTGRRGAPVHPVTLATIESLDAVPGVRMLPKHRFKKPVSEVPVAQRQAFLAFAELRGIPQSHYAGVSTWGDVIKRTIQFGRNRVFGARVEETDEEEFE